jgi:hypothetical protein
VFLRWWGDAVVAGGGEVTKVACERLMVMVVMRSRCMGMVDDGGGSGRPVFVC